MAIRKTTILITVLHEDTDDVASWDMQTVFGEMNEGCIVGAAEHVNTVEVGEAKLIEELEAVGNDGTFFDLNEEIEG